MCTSSSNSNSNTVMGKGLSKSQVFGGREHFFAPGPAAQMMACQADTDCDASSRCDNLNTNSAAWSCKPCADVGCPVGKTCGTSSDCAQGLSCQSGVCTIGGVLTNLNNSGSRTTTSDTDTVGQSYEAQRQAYVTLGASGDISQRECAVDGTCGEGFPCDTSSLVSQCAPGLMCDAGVCKISYSGL